MGLSFVSQFNRITNNIFHYESVKEFDKQTLPFKEI